MITYFVREIGNGNFYAVCKDTFDSAQKSPEMDTCIKYRCFYCGDIPIERGVILHRKSCKVGADERFNECLFLARFLLDYIATNDVILRHTLGSYNDFMDKHNLPRHKGST